MRPLIESVEFSQEERIQHAKKYLPIFTGEEEHIKNPIKTSRFTEMDSLEEYHVPLKDGDILGIIKSKTVLDFDINFRSQERLVSMFRQMSIDPLIDQGVTQICDEAMSFNYSPDSEPMKLIINKQKLERKGFWSEKIDKSIQSSYEDVLALLDFRQKGWDYFHRWFVDGKIFFELIFNKGEREIKEIKLLSPYNIMKIKSKNISYYLYDETREQEVLRRNMIEDDAYLDQNSIPIVNYNNVYKNNSTEQVKLIPEKYVIAVESGIKPFGYPMSPLYYVRKNLNQLQLLQDAMVVYRISRAPERRAIYVDVGNNRPAQVKQIMNEVAKEFKQKLVFDQRTGNILDHRHVFATTEDFFMPRYGNGQTTEIKTLPGGENLGKIQDIEYFLEQTYRSLKIPLSRFGLGDTSIVNFGNEASIERDEITFSKYIKRLRLQFNKIIWGLLQRQLLCRNVIKLPSEFKILKEGLYLHYEGENYYSDIQRMDQYQRKISIFQQLEPTIDSGRLSEFQAYRDVFGMSEDDVSDMYNEKSDMVKMKLDWLNDNLENLKAIAKIEGDLALLQNPELLVKIEELRQKSDFTKEKYGNEFPDTHEENNKDMVGVNT